MWRWREGAEFELDKGEMVLTREECAAPRRTDRVWLWLELTIIITRITLDSPIPSIISDLKTLRQTVHLDRSS